MDLTKTAIPSNWVLVATLERDCNCAEPERFSFYTVGDQVALAQYHPMNGLEDVWTKVSEPQWMRDYYSELMAGEPYRDVQSLGYGRLDVRQGRRPKAVRVR
jgi:hypothetical protein